MSYQRYYLSSKRRPFGGIKHDSTSGHGKRILYKNAVLQRTLVISRMVQLVRDPWGQENPEKYAWSTFFTILLSQFPYQAR